MYELKLVPFIPLKTRRTKAPPQTTAAVRTPPLSSFDSVKRPGPASVAEEVDELVQG
jgi:hypothetical protein